MPTARAAVLTVLVLLAATLLSGCDSSTSSSASSGAGPTPTTSASSPADGDPSSASSDPADDARSQALCSALSNAVGARTAWQLGEPQPASRTVAGIAVPACEVGAATGDPATTLTVAYLPATSGLAGQDLLAGLCQAVVGARATQGRSCARPTQAPARAGVPLGRADLTTSDSGVLVLSFRSAEPSYRATSVDDLAAVGQALASDQLLARAIG